MMYVVITSFIGENDGLRLQAVRDFVAAFEREYGEMSVERFEGDNVEFNRLLDAVSSIPFLCERKLVVIRDASMNSDFCDNFEKFLGAISDSNDVLLVEKKLDKRTSFYKLLQKKTNFTQFQELDGARLGRWAVDYVKNQNGSLSLSDANYLVQRVGDAAHVQSKTGASQLLLQNELDKLILYDPAITRRTIDLMTDESPASKTFDLLDAAFAGDVARMQTLYADQRAQGSEPQQIIGMLVWQLYIFAVVKSGQGKNAEDIARASKLNLFSVEKAQRALRSISLAKLRAFITKLRELDERIKTEGINPDETVQYYLLSLKED